MTNRPRGGSAPRDRYTRIMELDLTPETQAQLNELAQRTHRGTDELLAEAVSHFVAYNEWLARKVADSRAAVTAVK